MDALRVSREHRGPIRLLIADVASPSEGDRLAAREIARERPGIKVICLSGYPSDSDRERGIPSDAIEFIGKPFSPMELLSKVRKILDA